MTSSPSSSVTFSIQGLRCNNCAMTLDKALNKLDNVKANVSYALASISLDCPLNQLSIVIHEIEKLGYQLNYHHYQSKISGWRCNRCAFKTKQILEEQAGIKNVMVNSTTNTINFEYVADVISIIEINNMLINEGQSFDSTNSTAASHGRISRVKRHWKLLLSMVCTFPLMLPMLMMIVGYSFEVSPWLAFLLATIVQFIVGDTFYRGAWLTLKNKQANMDSLVVLGTSAAYFYSCYVLIAENSQNQALYFESSAVIITFISLGKYLEGRAKTAAGQAMRELLALSPQTALLIDNNHEITEVTIDEVKVGNYVRVLAGTKIPVDGVIISGKTEIDESLITGESLPIFKQENDLIIAGSINGQGTLTVEVTAVGKQSRLHQIIAMVEKAQATKAPIEHIVDKVAAWFVPTVMIIAVITFFLWFITGATFETALINSVAVLVVACPCALGLATPAAIVVGSGVAAKHGIVINDTTALEIAGNIDTVAFDKTGTLTQGKPKLVKYDWLNKLSNHSSSQDYSLLKSVLMNSEHPLSKAISKAEFLTNVTPQHIDNITVIAGLGMTATYQGQTLLLGNKALMESMGVTDFPKYEDIQSSVVLFAIDHQLMGCFYLQDTLRTQSIDVIKSLKKLNINTLMLSGDHKSSVTQVAQQLNISEFKGQLTPKDKLDYLTSYQHRGAVVAMVGDGINDAPALAQSDLGIAMGSGTQTAITSAKITLMYDDPLLVLSAITISKMTWRTVKQNLFLAFIFNAIAIPAAAMGYLSPQLAGLAMACSSLTVLANALSLKRC